MTLLNPFNHSSEVIRFIDLEKKKRDVISGVMLWLLGVAPNSVVVLAVALVLVVSPYLIKEFLAKSCLGFSFCCFC